MKIVFFTMTMEKGGAERAISTLCNNWRIKKDQLFIVTCLDDEAKYNINDGIQHIKLINGEEYRTKGKVKTLPLLINRYIEEITQINPDVVVSFLPEPCLIAALLKEKTKTVVIGSERGNPYYQYNNLLIKKMVRYLYKKMDGFVFQTVGAQDFFGRSMKKKSTIIGNPLDDILFEPFDRKSNKQEIVSVGRFTDEKNYPLLVDAIYLVIKRGYNITVKIYGRYDENNRIVEKIEELGLRDNVLLMGECNDIHVRIRNAGMFVLSSKSEGMPNALMEAMALGLPVVATDCPSGGPRQLIKDGYNGLLAKNEDEESLANAIIKLISDRELAEYLGKNARNTMKDYRVEKICKQWQAYINDLCEEKNDDFV